MYRTDIKEAAAAIRGGRYVTAFTGAGISVESGVPAFRGSEGIWSKYDPDILDLYNFMDNPEESWPVIRELFYQYFDQIKPNPAHYFLAGLEKNRMLKALITQNIDNLHFEAGSRKIIEYHGNSRWLVCTRCGERTPIDQLFADFVVPRCRKDGALLKPDFVFFGEPIPVSAANQSVAEADKSDVMILIGTTGEVMPASMIPRMAKNSGALIIEINTEETLYTQDITDIFLKGKATEVCEGLQSALKMKMPV